MLGSIIGILAPIFSKLAIKGVRVLGNKSINKISDIIENKTGIKLSEKDGSSKAALDSINKLSPEDLLQLKLEILKSDTNLAAENRKAIIAGYELAKEVNKTMRVELDSTDKWARRWRPFNGFLFAVIMSLFGFVLSLAIVYCVFTNQPELLTSLSNYTISLLPIIGTWGSVLGISALTRGKEKIALAQERLK